MKKHRNDQGNQRLTPTDTAHHVETRVRDALSRVLDPEIRKPITELDMVGGVRVTDGAATVDIKLTIIGCPAAATIERDVRVATAEVEGVTSVIINVSVMTRAERDELTNKLRGGRAKTLQFGPDSLTRIYAITSGKGGVGKSTLTANLAVAFAARGLRVGIVDADVFGFSIPGLLGIAGSKPTQVNEMILPPLAFGVKVISIGMFVEPSSETGTAVAWRGPMLHRTMSQFLTDVYFGDLDILLLDLPPGTGDIAISLGQLLPQAEVLVVTTPQPAAADVAERSGLVARRTGQKVIGVIENMAGLLQPDGSMLDIFGSGGGADAAARLSTPTETVPLLGSIPLSVPLRAGGDTGAPIILSTPDDPAAVAIAAIAEQLATRSRGLAGRKLGLSVS
jgi:ATP-binding protein involved in chromosome partitioning